MALPGLPSGRGFKRRPLARWRSCPTATSWPAVGSASPVGSSRTASRSGTGHLGLPLAPVQTTGFTTSRSFQAATSWPGESFPRQGSACEQHRPLERVVMVRARCWDECPGQRVEDHVEWGAACRRCLHHRRRHGLGTSCGVESVGPAKFHQQPAPRVASPSGSGLFAVATGQTESVSYQWEIQTVPGVWEPLGDAPLVLPCGASALATPVDSASVTISIRPCPGADPGDPQCFLVRCAATNACGTTASDAVTYTTCPG